MLGNPEGKNALGSFGLLMGSVFSIIAAILFYKGKVMVFTLFGGIAAAFFFLALIRPNLLSSVYVRWMKFADVIGRFNAKVILSLMYAVIFTPLRALLFVLGKDPLQRKFNSSLESYWSDHESTGNALIDFNK